MRRLKNWQKFTRICIGSNSSKLICSSPMQWNVYKILLPRAVFWCNVCMLMCPSPSSSSLCVNQSGNQPISNSIVCFICLLRSHAKAEFSTRPRPCVMWFGACQHFIITFFLSVKCEKMSPALPHRINAFRATKHWIIGRRFNERSSNFSECSFCWFDWITTVFAPSAGLLVRVRDSKHRWLLLGHSFQVCLWLPLLCSQLQIVVDIIYQKKN